MFSNSELKKIAEILTISIDKLLAENYNLSSVEFKDIEEGINISERISIPELKVLKFKTLIFKLFLNK